jgi:hypothetical protein
MGKKCTLPHCFKTGEIRCGPHRELLLVLAFIKCCSNLWDPWIGCPKLTKAELRFWASLRPVSTRLMSNNDKWVKPLICAC